MIIINSNTLPEVISVHNVYDTEFLSYYFMPIKLAYTDNMVYEKRILQFSDLILDAADDFYKTYGSREYIENYIYLTVKRLYQDGKCGFNRPGYHLDGFGTNDINYIWSDCQPTIFNTGSFHLSEDDNLSLVELEQQAKEENEITYPDNVLLKLDATVPHKVNSNIHTGVRTFFKLTFSKDRFNLIGNTHNYELDYNWEMKPRKNQRNICSVK
jgi:hypothetical protein